MSSSKAPVSDLSNSLVDAPEPQSLQPGIEEPIQKESQTSLLQSPLPPRLPPPPSVPEFPLAPPELAPPEAEGWNAEEWNEILVLAGRLGSTSPFPPGIFDKDSDSDIPWVEPVALGQNVEAWPTVEISGDSEEPTNKHLPEDDTDGVTPFTPVFVSWTSSFPVQPDTSSDSKSFPQVEDRSGKLIRGSWLEWVEDLAKYNLPMVLIFVIAIFLIGVALMTEVPLASILSEEFRQ